MLVMSDLDDVFLPKPTDILVNLTEARASIENLLSRLSDMFQDNHTVGSALGPAMQAGFKLIVRVIPFQTMVLYLIGCHAVGYGRKISRFVFKSSKSWSWCVEEQRGS